MDRVFLVDMVCFRLMTQRFLTFGRRHAGFGITVACPRVPTCLRQTLVLTVVAACMVAPSPAPAQFGGQGGMGGGGQQSGGPQGPAERPKFRDHIHAQGALPIGREKGDKVVANVRITGNRTLS